MADYFAHILYLSNTHKLHGHRLGVLYAWMNGYSTLLQILDQVNTLSSRLNMDYSCTSQYFLTNQIEKTTTKIIIQMLVILGFKILSLCIDDIIPVHVKIIDF